MTRVARGFSSLLPRSGRASGVGVWASQRAEVEPSQCFASHKSWFVSLNSRLARLDLQLDLGLAAKTQHLLVTCKTVTRSLLTTDPCDLYATPQLTFLAIFFLSDGVPEKCNR